MKTTIKLTALAFAAAVTVTACDPAKKTNETESTKVDSTTMATDSTKKDTAVVVDSLKKDTVKK